MKLKPYFVMVLLFLGVIFSAFSVVLVQAQNSNWIIWNTFLGSGYAPPSDMVIDQSGNSYGIGDSKLSWGKPIRQFAGGKDAYLIKVDGEGNLIWNTFLGAADNDDNGRQGDNGMGIAVARDGSVYVSGRSEASWGQPLNPHAPGEYAEADPYVAKLNNAGTLIWNTFLGSKYEPDSASDIVVDKENNVYITGGGKGTWGNPKHEFNNKGDSDAGNMFVAKLRSDGSLAWNTFWGAGHGAYGNKIVMDADGDIYVAGTSLANWGNPINPYIDGVEIFVTKLNNEGDLIWNTFIHNDNEGLGGISSDTFGNVYVVSYENVTKLDKNGILVWNKSIGKDKDMVGGAADIQLDTAGNIYISGTSTRSWGTPLNPYGGVSEDAWIAKFNSDGNMVWNTFLGLVNGGSTGFELDSNGIIYITGYSSEAWGNPANPLLGGSGSDVFVAKLDIGDPSVAPGLGKVTITGHVTDGFTHPLADLKIQIVNAQQIEEANVFTNQNGDFKWSGDLPEGTYEVKAWLEDGNGRKKVLYGAQQLPVWAGRPLNIIAGQSPYSLDINFGAQRSDFTSSITEQVLLDDLAIMYFHVSEVDRYATTVLQYQTYRAPKSIWGWATTDGTYYEFRDQNGKVVGPSQEQVVINASNSIGAFQNQQINREWHETFHHLMYQFSPDTISKFNADECSNNQCSSIPHGGWKNKDTRDSWVEGWATFWPCAMQDSPFYEYPWINIELNYKSWSFGVQPIYYPFEDKSVAALLWDLYDERNEEDKDNVDLGHINLFRAIVETQKNGVSTTPIKTIRDLYLKLKELVEKDTLRNQDGRQVTKPDLDQIFIAHGFFADREWDQTLLGGWRRWDGEANQTLWDGSPIRWETVEEVGFGGQPNRKAVPFMPNAYLGIDFPNIDSKNEQAGVIKVEILSEIPHYNFSYTENFQSLPTKIYITPLPEDLLGLIKIQVTTDKGLTGEYLTDSQTYLQKVMSSNSGVAENINVTDINALEQIKTITIIQRGKSFANEQLTFAALSEAGTDIIYHWDFGDGVVTTGQLINHVYTTPGDYTVTVTASNSLGTATQTKTITVVMNEIISQSPLDWIQKNIVWVIVSLIAVGLMGFLAVTFILMKRRRFAFAMIGAKARKPLSKQTAPPANRISAVSVSPINKPIALSTSERQVKTAQNLAKAGKFQESFTILKEVVALEPNNAQAWLFLGGNLINLNDYANAEKCLQHAKRLGHPKADQSLEWLKAKRDGMQ